LEGNNTTMCVIVQPPTMGSWVGISLQHSDYQLKKEAISQLKWDN